MRRLETELGPPVVAWLTESGHDVYQEVDAWSGVADIVAVNEPMLVVVELKVALSFELLHQARRWRGVAHQVWVAVPHAKRSDGRAMAEHCYAREGIGVATVSGRGKDARLDIVARPAFNRRADVQHVRKVLREEHKTFKAAGSVGGAHWSTFKSTVAELKLFLGKNPGASIADAVADVKHHYATDAGARATLVSLIRRGVISGVRTEKQGRALRLYLEGA